MVKFEDLSKRAQEVAQQLMRSLSNPAGAPMDMIVVNIPAGREKDDLSAFLAQLTHAHERKIAYISVTQESNDRTCHDLNIPM